MRHECGWSSAGFSLIEVVVSIAILGMAVIPISGGMVLSHRLNARSEQVLQARLEVSGAVEALMAEGIAEDLKRAQEQEAEENKEEAEG